MVQDLIIRDALASSVSGGRIKACGPASPGAEVVVELVTPTTPGPPLLVGVAHGVAIKLLVPPPPPTPAEEIDCGSAKSAVVVAEEATEVGDVVMISPDGCR